MNDETLVADVAADLVRRMGDEASEYVRDEVEIAAGRGDELSEQAWIDIANAVHRILDNVGSHKG
jgi:hypothetical protein